MQNHQVTQAEVDAYRDAMRAEFISEPFAINSNRFGLHVRCCECGDSTTRNPEMFIRQHICR